MLQVWSVVLLVTVLDLSDAPAQSLVVHMDTEQTEYVIREPVKFRVALKNVSNEPVNIPSVSEFNNNMNYTYLLITTPEENTERRRYQYIYDLKILGTLYAGELLAPGDSIQFFLYPNFTFKEQSSSDYATLTFGEPGFYDVRVCYTVPSGYKILKASAPDDVCSSAVTLHFRKPDAIEKDILASFWKKNSVAMAHAEWSSLTTYDIGALRAALRSYPQHPMIRWVRYELGRQLMSPEEYGYRIKPGGPPKGDVEEAAGIFEALQRNYPDFRPAEVAYFLAKAYLDLGRRSDAARVLLRAIDANPGLRTDARFMPAYVYAKTGDNHESSSWALKRQVLYRKREGH